MLKVSWYSEAETHLCNGHWVYIKPKKKPKTFEPALWACIRHFEPNCSNPQWRERNVEWESARNAFTYFKGPTKNHIQAVSSMSIHPPPMCQAGAPTGAHPSQGLPLTLCTPSPPSWHFWSLFVLMSSLQFEKTGVPALGGTGRLSYCTLYRLHFLQITDSLFTAVKMQAR